MALCLCFLVTSCTPVSVSHFQTYSRPEHTTTSLLLQQSNQAASLKQSTVGPKSAHEVCRAPVQHQHYKGRLGSADMDLLAYSVGTVRRVSFLGDGGCHGDAYGPTRCGRQLFNFCIQPSDHPLHGFTTLVNNKGLVHWKCVKMGDQSIPDLW